MAHIPPSKEPMPYIDPINGPNGYHMLAPNWEKPKDLKEANHLLSKFRQSHTKKQFHELFHPTKEIDAIIQKAQLCWSELLKEALDDLLENGKQNCKHFVLAHKKTKANYKEVIYHKVAKFTISRTLYNSKKHFWIKKEALTKWIDQFLPEFDSVLFTNKVCEGLKRHIKPCHCHGKK